MDARDPSVPDRLAALLLTARRAVILAGQRLGHPERVEASARGEWARRASLENLLTRPADFWDYYEPLAQDIARRQPEPVHTAIARLQQAGIVSALITQGVDRLHVRAGSPDAVEVYGTALVARCERCGERYGLPEVSVLRRESADGVPRCSAEGCGYPLRPTGTLWNEPLPAAAVRRAWELAGETDCFVVLDSELRTAPLALLPSVPLRRGAPLVVIGEAPTRYDRYAALLARGPSPPAMIALADLLAPAQEARAGG
jgi:NAD-dependent protein deacetylase/lipoamidase